MIPVRKPPKELLTPSSEANKWLEFVARSLSELSTKMYVASETKTVGNSGTEATLIGSGVGSLMIPASYFAPGKGLEVRAWGFIGSDGATPGTLRLRLYKGSTTLLDTGANTPTVGLSNAYWELRTVLHAYSTIAVIGQGIFTILNSTTGVHRSLVNTSPVVINAEGEALNLTAQWSAADAQDSVSCTNFQATMIQ